MFDADDSYDAALVAAGAAAEPSLSPATFSARVAKFEPSDILLFVDPRYFPGDGFDPSCLIDGLGQTPRMVRHLVALDMNAGGTNERVEFDPDGKVRRVQRYYDAVTWTVATGIVASLVPVSPPTMADAVSVRCHLQFA